MNKKGKTYVSKKPLELRPQGDFYETPKSLTWELIKQGEIAKTDSIVDPCQGERAIVGTLIEEGFSQVHGSDLFVGKDNRDIYSYEQDSYDVVVTNFPFSEWDQMVWKSLEIAPKVITIGRVNYFGTHKRNVEGLWDHLIRVYIFDRMVDYRTPYREDGSFHVGALVTGWFVFERRKRTAPTLHVVDVQRYAKLGAY